jgi:hypothetical protein
MYRISGSEIRTEQRRRRLKERHVSHEPPLSESFSYELPMNAEARKLILNHIALEWKTACKIRGEE